MRREKRRSAALLGHSGPRSTGVRLRSSFGRAWHLTTFDDADVDSEMFIRDVHPIRQGVHRRVWVERRVAYLYG